MASFDPTRLADLRKKAGLSQRELARRAGVAQSVIAGLERGKHTLSQSALEKLTSALGVAPSDLLA
jgi:transcriptional regulator with XRE-family HTH domain